tara:strand:+ start:1755 stop:3236 length:1482 start_codon:yes stop_codon:yes gene_type:complete
MAVDKTIKINVDAKDGIKQVEKLKKGVEATGKGAKNSKKGFSAMQSGIKGVGLAFKAMGVGLIVSAFVALKDALGENQAVMDKVNLASAVIGDIFQKLVNTVMAVVKSLGLLGKAIGKVLKGEFKEAGDLAKESFNGVKDAVVGSSGSFSDFVENAKESAKETVAFAKALTNLNKEVKLAEANQRLLQLQYQKDAEVQRQLRDDISLTFEERIAANEKLGQILDEQFAEEQALAQKKLDLAELELSRNKDNVDLQVAVINAKTEMADLDERITGQRSEQLTNLKALEKEKADAEIAEIKRVEDAKQKAIDDQKKIDDQKEKDRLKGIADKKKQDDLDLKNAKLLAENKKMLQRKAVSDVVAILGEESKAAKAIQVGMAIRDTFLGATKALAQGGIFGALSAGGIIAMGMANVKKIMSTGDDGGGGDAAAGGGGGDVPAPPTEVVGGIGGMIPNLENISPAGDDGAQPVQAFVVETDISNSQALQSELDLQATL